MEEFPAFWIQVFGGGEPTHQLHSLIPTAKHDEWHGAAVLQGMDAVGATETHRNTDKHYVLQIVRKQKFFLPMYTLCLMEAVSQNNSK